MTVDLREGSPPIKSDDGSVSAHTSDDMQESLNHEETKGNQRNTLVTQEVHNSKAVKDKQANLFNRPKATSYKSEQKGFSIQQTLRNSLPKQIQNTANDRSRGVQTGLKGNSNYHNSEFNSVN